MIFYEIKYKYLERLFFMNQTNLGITSLKISTMGLGIMRMNAKTPQQATEALEAAFDNGINFIDSADIYGQGESEKIFGQVLKLSKIKRDDLFIQSKVGIILTPKVCSTVFTVVSIPPNAKAWFILSGVE